MVEKLGPEIFDDFNKGRLVTRSRPTSGNLDAPQTKGMKRVGSNLSEAMQYSENPHQYYHEIELNNVFESLNDIYLKEEEENFNE